MEKNPRKHRRELFLKKQSDFEKQEKLIFGDIKPKRGDRVPGENRKGGNPNAKDKNVEKPRAEGKNSNLAMPGVYTNTASREYAEDIDFKREKNLSNRVWSQGQGHQEHRQREKEAKVRRNGEGGKAKKAGPVPKDKEVKKSEDRGTVPQDSTRQEQQK
jgi:hypothetical protein